MHRLQGAALLSLLVLSGCTPSQERGSHRASPTELPLEMLADSAAMLSMPAAPWPYEPRVRATIEHLAPSRSALDPASPDAPPLPPGVGVQEERGGGFEFDDDLHPPIPKGAAPFVVTGRSGGWVALDVRVGEQGEVTDAEWHDSSSADSVQVAAAIIAAFSMRFHPAIQRGRAVAVWARQRFEIAPTRR